MSYQALYRKWRPQVFEDVIGQKHITETLKNQIISRRIAHAYLFCGTRGTGKTSTAKIFSRAINCIHNQGDHSTGNPCNMCEVCAGIMNGSILDVVEIDAASNNGVDNVREIREEVVYSPARSQYKVYIIDEVHMLSTGAFNALLKTLEEPPAHVIFILATTEPHKIPATILSRCQRFDFKRITTDDIAVRLKQVIGDEGIKVDDQGLRLIARVSEGSMRDALSILDQCIAFNGDCIKYEDIVTVLGVVDHSFMFDIAQSIADKNANQAVKLIDRLIMDGRDIVHFMDDFIEHFRNLLMCKVLEKSENVLDMPKEMIAQLKEQSINFTQEKIINCIKVLSDAHSAAKWAANPRIILEIAVIKLCQQHLDTSTESLLDRIADLEYKLATGTIQIKAPDEVSKGSAEKEKTQQQVISEAKKNKSNPINKKATNKADYTTDAEISKVASLWPEVINELRRIGKLALFGHLSDVRVEPIEGVLGIIFKDSCATNKLMVSRNENIQALQEVIAKLSGVSVEVKCFLEKELKENQQKDEEDKLEQLIRLKDELGDTMQVYDE
jgi:DNA polymerase-3 subunit gamma/tau